MFTYTPYISIAIYKLKKQKTYITANIIQIKGKLALSHYFVLLADTKPLQYKVYDINSLMYEYIKKEYKFKKAKDKNKNYTRGY